MGKQRYEAAIAQLKALISGDSSFAPAYTKLVAVAQYAGQLDAAQVYFSRFVESFPQNPYAFHALGLVLRERQQWQKAYDSIAKAIGLKSDYVAAYRVLPA